jgi:hypothetical protein
MTYYFIECYDEYEDYGFYVFANTEDEAKNVFSDFLEDREVDISEIHGPFELKDCKVLSAELHG